MGVSPVELRWPVPVAVAVAVLAPVPLSAMGHGIRSAVPTLSNVIAGTPPSPPSSAVPVALLHPDDATAVRHARGIEYGGSSLGNEDDQAKERVSLLSFFRRDCLPARLRGRNVGISVPAGFVNSEADDGGALLRFTTVHYSTSCTQ